MSTQLPIKPSSSAKGLPKALIVKLVVVKALLVGLVAAVIIYSL